MKFEITPNIYVHMYIGAYSFKDRNGLQKAYTLNCHSTLWMGVILKRQVNLSISPVGLSYAFFWVYHYALYWKHSEAEDLSLLKRHDHGQTSNYILNSHLGSSKSASHITHSFLICYIRHQKCPQSSNKYRLDLHENAVVLLNII